MTKQELLSIFKQKFKQYCDEHKRTFGRWFVIKNNNKSDEFVVYVREPNIRQEAGSESSSIIAYDKNIAIKGGCVKWTFKGKTGTQLTVTQTPLSYADVDWVPDDIPSRDDTVFKFSESPAKQDQVFEKIQAFFIPGKHQFSFAKAKKAGEFAKTNMPFERDKVNPDVWEIFFDR